MWMAEQHKRRRPGDGSQIGSVTLGGDPAGVCLDGERRDLPVFGPGGYLWRPAREDQVLVIKTGSDGEAPCIAGKRNETEEELGEGEVLIYSQNASIRLSRGVISMEGMVLVNGKEVVTEE